MSQPKNADPADVAVHAAPTPIAVRGATAVIPQKLITDGEVVILAIKPSLWFILLVSARWLLAAAIIIVGAKLLESVLTYRLVTWLTQLSVLAAAVRVLVGMMEWLGRVYVLTDRRIMRLRGVVHIDLFECQLARIQQVVLSLPWSERAVLCGTVLFYTAGTDTVDAAWMTVARPAAVYQAVLAAIEKYTRQRE